MLSHLPVILFLLFFSVPGNSLVVWTVKEDENTPANIKLFCNTSLAAGQCNPCSFRWFGGPNQRLLSYNGSPSDHGKYSTTKEEDGFGLIIKNFNNSDTAVVYSCSYGFDSYTKNLTLDVGCTWRVQKQISKYGEDLKLFCSAENYTFPSRTSKWFGGPAQNTISINGKVKDSTKYNATIERDGFGLIIRNVTENDLNVTYQFSYGFSKSDKILLLQHDAFKALPDQEQTNSTTDVNEELIIGILFGVIITSMLIVLTALHNKRKLKNIAQGTKSDVILFQEHDQDKTIAMKYSSDKADVGYSTESEASNKSMLDDTASDFLICHQSSEETQNKSMLDDTAEDMLDCHTLNEVYKVHNSVIKPYSPILDGQKIGLSKSSDKSSMDMDAISMSDSTLYMPYQHDDFTDEYSTYPAYRKLLVRKQSFTEWSLSSPSKCQMATAGFFYSGCQTIAQCFCCGLKQKWKENDDPYNELIHINCSYLLKIIEVSKI